MFSSLGIYPEDLPKHKKCNGRLLIVGGARCVWDDLAQTNIPDDVMCINDIIMHFPAQVKHAYSNDQRWLPKWIDARRPRYKMDFPENLTSHTILCGDKGMVIWPFPGHGTSGLNAVYVGLALGYDEITLAGIPLTSEGHYFDPPNGWHNREQFSNFDKEVKQTDNGPRYWEQAAQHIFNGRVKSMSGRTKELLDRY